MHIEFFGAAAEVTGSCHILHINGARILFDCGLIQGGKEDEARNADPFPFDAAAIDAVVLSHAHLDHCGRLPLLRKRGYAGPVYAQEATCELADILLADAANLEQRDAEYLSRKTGKHVKPLFTVKQAREVMRQFRAVGYGEIIEVIPGVQARFRDAGHILGSCAVEVWVEEAGVQRKFVFSGDLGQYDAPILEDPEHIGEANAVLMESTYGNRRHRERQDTVDEIGEIISTARAEAGNILIPAFAIGRSQEILYQLGKHYEEWGLDRFRIFLDSPMAIKATKVYRRYSELHDEEADRVRNSNDGVSFLPRLQFSRRTEESMAINQIRSGAIVIAGSGMCNGGRIVHHLKHNLGRPECHVVIVGYQARGSLGRRLVDRHESVRIHGREVPVRARIHTVGGLSAHGDQDDLARWYECMEGRPPVWLVHGEKDAQAAFRDYLKNRNGAEVHLPEPGDVLELRAL